MNKRVMFIIGVRKGIGKFLSLVIMPKEVILWLVVVVEKPILI